MVKIILNNLITTPIIFFLSGIALSILNKYWLDQRNFKNRAFPTLLTQRVSSLKPLSKLHVFLSYFLLFSIGLKGGGAFMEHSTNKFFSLLITLIGWGLVHPFISYWLLRKLTKIDRSTATAIAACFGSVSVMTFAAAAAFLEKLQVPYQTLVIAFLATMEVPAILSGLFISKWRNESIEGELKNLWIHALFNKTILMIFIGMAIGMISYRLELNDLTANVLILFKPCLCLFLFHMGVVIAKQKNDLNQFSWPLGLFGFYMPLIGGVIGVVLSYLFNLDPGTGTLIAVLCSSASYIAVPAVVKIAIPQAKEAIYLPLSLGIAFPFNVVIGIPIYYILATKILS